MKYTKHGIRATEESVNSVGPKIGKKISLIFVRLLLIAVIGAGIIGLAAGIGVFKGTDPKGDEHGLSAACAG